MKQLTFMVLLRRWTLAAGLGLSISGVFADSYTYTIDAQPLATALTHFAEQSELQILFRPQDIPAIRVTPLHGQFTTQEAIAHLLRDTALQYTLRNNAIVIFQSPPKTDIDELSAGFFNEGVEEQGAPLPASPDEMIVTGIRGSVRRNLAQKKNADSVVDAITSEDVGKFPDKNIADALQRIPGVSVDRIWGEGRDINIRGTDKDINRTLMNGQNVASAYWWANDNPGRGFNYTILASELIASLAVHKSPTADLDEGSIGGTVIIYTHKPFDMDNNTLRINLEGQYSELPDAWDPQISLLGSWKNSAETLGVLASFNWQNRHMRRDGLEAFPDNSRYDIVDDQGQVTEDVYVIWGGGSAIFQQERERQTNNITLQWRPVAAWELALNYVESSMAMNNSNQNFLFMPGGFKLRETPPVTVSNPRFGATGDGRQTLLGGVMNNPDSVGAAIDSIFRQAYVRSALYDLDMRYQGDVWQWHTQLGVTSAEGGTDHDRLYRFLGNTRQYFSLSRDSIEVSYLDLDPQNSASLARFSSDSRDWLRRMEDDETYGQMDVERDLDTFIFKHIKLGFKWRDHSIENNRRLGRIDTTHAQWSMLEQIGLEEVSSGLTPTLHRNTASEGSLTRFAWADQRMIADVIDPLLAEGLMIYHDDPAAFYRINEYITAAYLKADFAQGAWHGNLGLRAVETRQKSFAYRNLESVEEQRRYHDYLPSINIAYDINDTTLWRFSASRVMARPTFQNLSPNIVIDATSGTASEGNPDLDAFRARQLDTGIEWYFDTAAILSATYFYKDISTFIYTETVTETIDGQQLNITRPYNAEGARINGVEVQWQQDLGNGVGWLSNYTYTDARVPSPNGQQSLRLPGNSRDQVNASVYYESPRYSVRLSYNYRSKSFGELISGSQDETDGYQQWDFSAAYTPKENTTVYVEGVNLTNEVIFYRTANDIPQGLYENGRRFSVGVRLRL